MGGRRLVISAVAAVAGLLVVVPAAQATFHETMIREVFPGSTAHPDASYVEIQMYAPGQNFVGPDPTAHGITLYNATGGQIGTFLFSADLPSPSVNQQTILIGDSGVATAFGVTPDLTDSNFNVPAAGAACWAGSIDCVAWGHFTGSSPTSVGTPIDDPGGIPDGSAIRRKITGGACTNLLDIGDATHPSDDTNVSSADFANTASPSPVAYTTVPPAMSCTPPASAPTTTINTKPSNPTNGTGASFTYSSNSAGMPTFECKLDGDPIASCSSSGYTYGGPALTEGSHTFQVRATDGNGTGPAATYSWTIDLTPPTITIVNHPSDPSSPNVSFTYQPSESVNNSTYQCSLVTGGADSFTSCLSSGKSYASLADGTYTFKVRATDLAGNQSTPGAFPAGTYTWTVDHLAADKTPPETTIDSKPPDPSDSSTAGFTYSSNEPGSTFECKLDTGAFTGCDPGGITYTGLQDGSHTFQVRATDPSSNTDLTPAGYTFNVALPSGTPPPGPTPPPLLPPETTINLKPPAKTHDRTPTFRFRSSEASSTFRCKVDKGAFKSCRSPFTTKTLTFGRHTLKIQAVSAGVVDPTPATFSFKVVKH